MRKVTVLFIDDDPTLQILASAMMNTGVFHVLSAHRTAVADKLLTQNIIDIIVCDVMMPDEDGLQFCKRVRETGNRIPILMLSAVSDPQTMAQASRVGVTDYLVKPFDIHVLQKKLSSMLKRPPAETQPPKASPKKSGLLHWFRS